ncbi:hypothetical protein HDU81_003069, partial [Chytriomyces hyalinus]
MESSVLTSQQRETLREDEVGAGSFKTLIPLRGSQQISNKIRTRIDNERYLRDHPEIKDILNHVMSQVLQHKPKNLRDLIADVFSDANLAKNVSRTKRH